MKTILKTLKRDLLERGGFSFFEWVWDGKLLLIHKKGKFLLYVHPDYLNDWRVSTSLIFYNRSFRKCEQRHRELDFDTQGQVDG